MKFKSIFIANISEVARPILKITSLNQAKAEVWEDHYLSGRCLFSDTDNRLLITPFPIDRDFFKDSLRLLGFRNTLNLAPRQVGDSICEAILQDSKLLKKIIKTISENPKIKLVSYAATKEFLSLVSFLEDKGLNLQTPETPTPKNYWLTEYYDSKIGFRETIPNLGKNFPKMPFGVVCSTVDEAVKISSYLLKKRQGCVFKTNIGLAGLGLKIIKKEEIGKGDITSFIKKTLKRQPFWQKLPFVVEEFVPPDLSVAGGAPNIELKIDKKGVHPLYVCGMRVTLQGVFRGVEIGKNAVPQLLSAQLFKVGLIFGKYLEKSGYKGYFEIDFVYGKKGLFPIEANLRRTGGTHVYELAKRLLGDDFAQKYYIVANNIFKVPKFTGRSFKLFRNSIGKLLYPIKGKKQGVVLTILSLSQKAQIGYVVIGQNKKRTSEIEREFIKKVE